MKKRNRRRFDFKTSGWIVFVNDLKYCVFFSSIQWQTAWTFNEFFYWPLFFFSKKKLRLVYQKWRWRWIKWYEGRQVENHDPTVVMFCCPWFVVDLWISSIWSVLSLSKLVGNLLSKLDWQCRYNFLQKFGRPKTFCLKIFSGIKKKTLKIFEAFFCFHFADRRLINAG